MSLLYGKYEFHQHLGQGMFANVSLISYKGEKYAMKKINSKYYNEKQVQVLMKLHNHENVIKFFEVDERSSFVLILMEYCNSGNVKEYQQKLKGGVFKQEQAIEAMYQIFRAIDFIHKQQVMHRDIKPENILIHQFEGKKTYKLADFGLSTQKNLAQTDVGTPYFVAPQIITGEGDYSNSVDVWAAGVSFYFMLTSSYPFEGDVRKKIKQFFLKKKSFLHEFNNENITDILRRIFVQDPKKRISVAEILFHPLFQKFRKLESKESINSNASTDINSMKSSITSPLFKNKLSSQKQEEVESPIRIRGCSYYPQPQLNPEQQPPKTNNCQSQFSFFRQKNNILIFILDDIKKGQKHFNPIHLKPLIYNVLKLYIIYHKKLLNRLNSASPNTFSSVQKYHQTIVIVKKQIQNAQNKFISYYAKCKKIQKQIEAAFKTQLNGVLSDKIIQTQLQGSFKRFYRLSTGYCYQNITILTQNHQKQQYLHLKVFICHSFNRLFTQTQTAIPQYNNWADDTPFKASLFNKWLNNQDIKIVSQAFKKIKLTWFRQ